MAKKKKRDIVAEAKRIAAENLEYQRQHFPGKISRGRTEHYYAPPPEKRPPAMRERMAKEESARRRVETRLREFEPKKKPTTQKKPAKKKEAATLLGSLFGAAKRISPSETEKKLEDVAGKVGKYRRGAN